MGLVKEFIEETGLTAYDIVLENKKGVYGYTLEYTHWLEKKLKEAINYKHCCESDSEQLPTGYTKCNCSNAKDRLDCGFECYNK